MRLSLLTILVLAACGGDTTVETAAGSGTGGQATGGQSAQGGNGQGGQGGGSSCTGCMSGFDCCNGKCVNTGNDILNCGGCGIVCQGSAPYCDNGRCGAPPCAPNIDCGPESTCCGRQCCDAGMICCSVPGPVTIDTLCVDPSQNEGTCPPGCTDCACASPDAPVATPDGERPIAALLPGDLVFSVEGQAIVAVPVLRAIRTPVETDHPMIEVELAGGETIRMSPGHPTGDGRTFAELATGGRLGDRVLTSVRRIAYGHAATHDILPASSTGIYFVAGVPVGSTLRMGRNTAAE